MKIRVLGGGWYGCHLTSALLRLGHEVELHEIADKLFAGASGGNPARLHLGFHYPRSRLTRAMCQEQHTEFMRQYGHLTATIPCNIYAVAADHSHVDFGNYVQTLRGEVDLVALERPSELGLANVEGAVLTGERHMVIRRAREYFTNELKGHVRFGVAPDDPLALYDFTIDCTFCARESVRIDRYEVCVTGILEGSTDRAVTIMDGPFPSIYPWDEEQGLLTITSARYTPVARCGRYDEAKAIADSLLGSDIHRAIQLMREQMREYWPSSWDQFRVVEGLVKIRAMPLSGSDARLVDVVRVDDRVLRIRAGKIDAIIYAERLVREALTCLR